VTFHGARPEVAGHPAATAALDRLAPSGCGPRLQRSDAHLVSVSWRCGTTVSAATVTLAGRPLTLSDLFQGDYRSYLLSVAATQLQAAGGAGPAPGALGPWYLTPAALAVAYPAGTVSYPLASLAAFISHPDAI